MRMSAIQGFLDRECTCTHALGQHAMQRPLPCTKDGCGCQKFHSLKVTQTTIDMVLAELQQA